MHACYAPNMHTPTLTCTRQQACSSLHWSTLMSSSARARTRACTIAHPRTRTRTTGHGDDVPAGPSVYWVTAPTYTNETLLIAGAGLSGATIRICPGTSCGPFSHASLTHSVDARHHDTTSESVSHPSLDPCKSPARHALCEPKLVRVTAVAFPCTEANSPQSPRCMLQSYVQL